MGSQRRPEPAQAPFPAPAAHPSWGHKALQAGGDGVTLARVIGARTKAGRYYALKATAKDTNLN